MSGLPEPTTETEVAEEREWKRKSTISSVIDTRRTPSITNSPKKLSPRKPEPVSPVHRKEAHLFKSAERDEEQERVMQSFKNLLEETGEKSIRKAIDLKIEQQVSHFSNTRTSIVDADPKLDQLLSSAPVALPDSEEPDSTQDHPLKASKAKRQEQPTNLSSQLVQQADAHLQLEQFKEQISQQLSELTERLTSQIEA
jgi:hypothetical protein